MIFEDQVTVFITNQELIDVFCEVILLAYTSVRQEVGYHSSLILYSYP